MLVEEPHFIKLFYAAHGTFAYFRTSLTTRFLMNLVSRTLAARSLRLALAQGNTGSYVSQNPVRTSIMLDRSVSGD